MNFFFSEEIGVRATGSSSDVPEIVQDGGAVPSTDVRGLPQYGFGILDDRVYVSCYEIDSGTVQAVIETDAQAVREWAESLYASFDVEARPPTAAAVVD